MSRKPLLALTPAVLLAACAHTPSYDKLPEKAPRVPMSFAAFEAKLRAADAADFVEVTTEGTSVGGRPLYLVKLDRGHSPQPWKVLLIGSQHGDEPAGREAIVDLIDLYTSSPDLLPKDVQLWLVPFANPDGAEATNRRNGADADLNRDHVLMLQPETRMLHTVTRRIAPDLIVDCHEYTRDPKRYTDKGLVRWPDIMMDAMNNPAFNEDAVAAGNRWVEEAKAPMKAAGVKYGRYYVGGPPDDGELRYSTPDVDDARNGLGSYGALSFIIESGWYGEAKDPNADLHRRVAAYQILLRRFVEDDSHRAEDRAVLARWRAGNWLPILATNFFWAKQGFPLTVYPTLSTSGVENPNTQTHTFNTDLVVKKSVKVPPAYAIAPEAAAPFRELLDRHGLKYEVLTASKAAKVQSCKLVRVEEEYDEVYNRYGGRQIVEAAPWADAELPAGTVVVELDKFQPWRVALLLEPQTLYGLYQHETFRKTVAADGTIPVQRVIPAGQ